MMGIVLSRRMMATTSALALMAALTVPSAARAEAAGGEANATADDQIPEVTVTARKRTESLQTVPVAVSVVSSEDAKQFNLNDLQDLLGTVPAANFKAEGSNKDRTIVVRGIGTFSTAQSVEPSVSTVVDGVVLARSGQATADFIDLDHVEVLRGPQGTLFGKNAASGAINITTEDPTAAQHEWLDASYYSGGSEYRIAGGVSGSILDDKLTGVIAALTSHYDGNVENAYLGKTVNGYDRNGIRSKFRYTADDLTLTLAMDYLRSLDNTPKIGVFTTDTNVAFPSGVVSAPNATLLKYLNGGGITPSTSNTKLLNDVESRVADNNGGISLTADWQLGQYDLTSITAYRRWSNRQYQDTDGVAPVVTGVTQIADRGDVALNQISEELRIASPKGHLVDYVAGLYYMRVGDTEDYARSLLQLASGAATNGYGIANFSDVSNNAAVFAEANINFTDAFRAILGVRVIHDNLSENFDRYSTSASILPGIRPSFVSAGSTSNFGYSDRMGLQYDVAKNIETYFTYSRGYLGPAYNLYFNQFNAVETAPLPPETSNAYEVGVKTTLLDNKLKANFALFQQDFQNYQTNLNQFVGGAAISDLINAGTVSSKGFESDITAKPIKNMTVNFATAYTLARIDKFAFVGPVPASAYDGKPLPNAPNWKINARVNYLLPVNSSYDIDLNTQFNWQSATQFQLQENADTIQPAYGIWDAGINLINSPQSWKIGLMVKNILNQHYATTLFEANGGVARGVPRDDSRYFGVDVRKDF